VSYLVLRGKCRTCGARFSFRYFFIELFTGLAFAGLFYLIVEVNVHDFEGLRWQAQAIAWGHPPPAVVWIAFFHHALLVSLLIVASFCDLDHQEIPFSITIPGTAIGLLFAICLPWPAPYDAGAPPRLPPWWKVANPRPFAFDPWNDPWAAAPFGEGPRQGYYAWPVWGPPPGWLPPGSWQLGIVTGIAGAAMGWLLLWLVRFLFTKGLGVEAMGLGDADLMMMAGAFLGWQAVVFAFFISVFPGLLFGIGQLVLRGERALPFGPSLAIGSVVAMLCGHWIGPRLQQLFFDGVLLLILGGLGGTLMFVLSFLLRVMRRDRSS
jgi:leader peptidase (prepilin peptidase) / N-methyltransferase